MSAAGTFNAVTPVAGWPVGAAPGSALWVMPLRSTGGALLHDTDPQLQKQALKSKQVKQEPLRMRCQVENRHRRDLILAATIIWLVMINHPITPDVTGPSQLAQQSFGDRELFSQLF